MIINLNSYYHSEFRGDLNKFFSTIPDESKFHEDRENKKIFSIQHERLTPSQNHLDFLDKEGKEYFAVGLFFTVLTDMVFYTHYKGHYNKFQSLTRYPKLIGNCLSWCHYHLHPRDIFNAMNQGRNAKEPHLLFKDKFLDATETMQQEISSFFDVYMNEINGRNFWEKCKIELPYRL